MATRFITSMLSVLFLARIAMGEPHLAERVPQLLHNRQSFIGGISLYATTSDTGEDGVCPSYTQTCPDSCCPDGCCPIGTYCYVNGDYCCPTDTDCSAQVDSAPSCANSTWIMYARPSSAVSPYFCCEPDQIALLPNLCVPNNGTHAASLLAPQATQAVGPISSNNPSGSSTITSGTSPSAKNTETSSTGSATPETSGAAATESAKPSPPGTGTNTIVHETTTQSPSGTSSASSSSTPKEGGAESLRSADWPWGVGVLVVALGFGMRLIM